MLMFDFFALLAFRRVFNVFDILFLRAFRYVLNSSVLSNMFLMFILFLPAFRRVVIYL